jgi:Nucleotidyl transferase of unknown function (DUF2204)
VNFSKDWDELFGLFLTHEVNFVLVGGHAVSAHGYMRSTDDIDLFVECSTDNARKIFNALNVFFGANVGFSKELFATPNKVIMFGAKPFRVVILTSIDGVSFNEAKQGCQTFKVGTHDIPVIGINELLKNKKASGRGKDLGDLEELEKIAKLRKK